MRIAVLGCGAMGTVLGAYLSKGACSVDLIDSYGAHVDALNANGAQIIGTVHMTAAVHAVTPDQTEGKYDLVFLLTKATANGDVLPKLLPRLHENSTVCTLQNGVPEPSVADIVGEKRTVGGTILWSAAFRGPGVSELTQNLENLDHYFDIGEIDGADTPRIRMVADVLGLMGRAEVSSGLPAARWGKLVNNACMSGMSAVCGATFGQVLEHPKAAACLSYLGREVKRCCEAQGYVMPTLVFGFSPEPLDLNDQRQFDASQKMFSDMYSVALNAEASMLHDLENGVATEVRMINGYVSEVGRAHGVETPFNDTVVRVVESIERGERTMSMDNLALFDDSWFVYAPRR
ncbi:MAG: ketopantoate reductase family protein [Clostridiales Family XIII bacterium]|nr:ketopantoate reductase family protein [Clostridiales Family XIII bacterium]